MAAAPFCKMNLPVDPFPAIIVEPVEYIDPSTSRLYTSGSLPTPNFADEEEPSWNVVPVPQVKSPPPVMLPPNTVLPVVLSRVNLSVAIAMSPLPVIDVTASIAPPMLIPVALVVMRAASL